jgi:hypothetical protein
MRGRSTSGPSRRSAVNSSRNGPRQSFRLFAGDTVYIGADRVRSGHPKAVGLFAASHSQNVRTVQLPNAALPRAVVVDGARLFVLVTRKPENSYDNSVVASSDLREWRELFHFRAAAFARAFEMLDGDFYFGLGCDNDDVRPETGEILRLAGRHAVDG